jgi:hypothetical protein
MTSKYTPFAFWNGPGWYLVAAEWHGDAVDKWGLVEADRPFGADPSTVCAVGSNGFFGTPAVILAYLAQDHASSGTRLTHSFGHPWPQRLIAGPIRDFSDLQVELEALRQWRAQVDKEHATVKLARAEQLVETKAQFPWRKEKP